MKRILFVIFAIALAFMSCNRRESTRENLQNAIQEFNDKQSAIETVSYYPKTYSEVKTDSIIGNTFKVSIKNYTLMDSEIFLNKTVSKKEKRLNYHRTFESEIVVSVEEKTILNTIISAKGFQYELDSEFWNYATLEHVWVNQEQSNSEILNLNISFINPKDESYKLYELVLNSEGKQHIYLKEEHS